MAFIGKNIPNLINGVSQQPTEVRLPSQAEAQVNMLSSVVDGLKRRPGTRHIAKLLDSSASGAFVHVYGRDRYEKYIVVILNGNIRVFDFEGNERVVNKPNGLGYLTSQTPAEAFRAVTVADYTFILNKDVVARAYDPAVGLTLNQVTQRYQVLRFVKSLSTTDLALKEPVPYRDAKLKGTFDAYDIRLDGKQYRKSAEATPQAAFMGYVASALTSDLGRNVSVNGNDILIPLKDGQPAYDFLDQSEENIIQYFGGVEGEGDYGAFQYLGTVVQSSIETRTVGYESAAGDTIPPATPQLKEGLVFVRLGDYGTTYTVKIDDVEVAKHTTSTTDRPSIGTTVIAKALYDKIVLAAPPGIQVVLKGNVIALKKTTLGEDFSLAVEDSNGNKSLVAFKGRVQSFEELPAQAPDGFTIKVAGQNGLEADDYYVKYTESNTGGEKTQGTWTEVPKKGLDSRPAPATMPHRLISNADGTFTFEAITWEGRAAGDETTAPDPSFINSQISDVFFYKNRLGLLCGENIVFSEGGGYYMYYPSTVIQFLDTHPIDISVSNDNVSILRHAVPFNESLLLFSDRTQFIMSPDEKLTAETVAVDVTTRFDASLQAKPVGAGKNVFFATKRGNFSSLREYYVDPEANVNDASDISSHCPEYISGEVRLLAASPNEDMVVCVTDAEPSSAYVYKYYWQGNEKVQSSWSRWDFGAHILGMAFLDGTLVVVVSRQDGTYLETMAVASDDSDSRYGFDTEFCLDRKGFVAAGTTPPWYDPGAVALDRNGKMYSGIAYQELLDAQGKATKDIFIGVPYKSYYEFSKLVLLDGESRVAPLVGRLQLRSMTLKYVDSGFFTVGVTSGGGDPHVQTFNGRRLGADTNVLGQVSIDSGRYRFPVLGHAPDTTIWIESSSHLPAAFLSAEWEAVYYRHSKRV